MAKNNYTTNKMMMKIMVSVVLLLSCTISSQTVAAEKVKNLSRKGWTKEELELISWIRVFPKSVLEGIDNNLLNLYQADNQFIDNVKKVFEESNMFTSNCSTIPNVKKCTDQLNKFFKPGFFGRTSGSPWWTGWSPEERKVIAWFKVMPKEKILEMLKSIKDNFPLYKECAEAFARLTAIWNDHCHDLDTPDACLNKIQQNASDLEKKTWTEGWFFSKPKPKVVTPKPEDIELTKGKTTKSTGEKKLAASMNLSWEKWSKQERELISWIRVLPLNVLGYNIVRHINVYLNGVFAGLNDEFKKEIYRSNFDLIQNSKIMFSGNCSNLKDSVKCASKIKKAIKNGLNWWPEWTIEEKNIIIWFKLLPSKVITKTLKEIASAHVDHAESAKAFRELKAIWAGHCHDLNDANECIKRIQTGAPELVKKPLLKSISEKISRPKPTPKKINKHENVEPEELDNSWQAWTKEEKQLIGWIRVLPKNLLDNLIQDIKSSPNHAQYKQNIDLVYNSDTMFQSNCWDGQHSIPVCKDKIQKDIEGPKRKLWWTKWIDQERWLISFVKTTPKAKLIDLLDSLEKDDPYSEYKESADLISGLPTIVENDFHDCTNAEECLEKVTQSTHQDPEEGPEESEEDVKATAVQPQDTSQPLFNQNKNKRTLGKNLTKRK